MSKLFLGFLAGICLVRPALAWNAEGHMVVSQMAYNHLNPLAKAKCDSLIAVALPYASSGTSNFVTAAVWADDFKSSLGTAIWHYIDLPFSLDGTPTNGFVPGSFDVVQAINLCVATLQNPGSTLTNQATCLRYLLHFAGDIQQPLHCSTAISASQSGGDAGGNGFGITGDWSNLHSLWDAGGGFLTDSLSRPLSPGSQTALSNKTALVEASYPYSPHSGTIPNPMAWAQEGWGLAQTVSYVGITRGASPSNAYTNTVQATTKQRMAAGGHRLADLLNTLYPSNPFNLTSLSRTNGIFRFSWSANAGQTYLVQWKQQLGDPAWTDLTNITASSNSASFTDGLVPTQRFYRVAQ